MGKGSSAFADSGGRTYKDLGHHAEGQHDGDEAEAEGAHGDGGGGWMKSVVLRCKDSDLKR